MALCRSSKRFHLKRVQYYEGLTHKTDSDRQQLVEHYEHLDALEAERLLARVEEELKETV